MRKIPFYSDLILYCTIKMYNTLNSWEISIFVMTVNMGEATTEQQLGAWDHRHTSAYTYYIDLEYCRVPPFSLAWLVKGNKQ